MDLELLLVVSRLMEVVMVDELYALWWLSSLLGELSVLWLLEANRLEEVLAVSFFESLLL
jgi:hypothetical protein